MSARTVVTGVALVAAAMAASAAKAADTSVTLRDVVARVEVIPEARTDVQVSITQGRKSFPAMSVGRSGGRLIVDGELRGRIRGCGSFGLHLFMHPHSDRRNPDARADVIGIGFVGPQDMPLITIRAPMDAHLDASGAVFGRVGPTHSLELANAGCGDWKVEDVSDALTVSIAGSGDIHTGRAGSLRGAISGSGDLTGGRINGQAHIQLSGSSDVKLEAVGALDASTTGSSDVRIGEITGGPVRVKIAGSGDVVIDGGRAGDVEVSTAGSGDFRLRGEARNVVASSAGSGDIEVAHASGGVARSQAGSGDIRIGH